MRTYVARRLLLLLPTLWVVSIVTFGLVNLMPGDVVTASLMESPSFRQEDLATLKQQLGIDRPAHEQYLRWLGRAVRGDLGKSLWSSKSVRTEILSRLQVTTELALIAFILSSAIAVFFGVLSAIRQDSLLDYALRLLSISWLSVPNFWIATLFIVLSARWFGYLPPLEYMPFTEDPLGNITQFMPPAVILALALSASIMRMTRSSMLEVMRHDYIRTAWAKGLQERTIVSRHALKNALIPILTIAGTQFATLMSGSIIIESIFNLPGLGNLALNSVKQRDFIMLQGVTLVIGSVFVTINLIVDLAYGWLDPRIRFE